MMINMLKFKKGWGAGMQVGRKTQISVIEQVGEKIPTRDDVLMAVSPFTSKPPRISG